MLLALLLIHLAAASKPSLLHYSLESRLPSYKEENDNYLESMRADDENELEDFFLLSANHPTKMSFRVSEDPEFKVDAVVERFHSNGTSKNTCRFPVFDRESHVTRHVKLRSMMNDIEMFQVMRLYQDPDKNIMDIYVINTTNCRYTKTEILKGYRFFKPGGVFVVIHPWEHCFFDIFVLNNKDECGTFICKYVFDTNKRSLNAVMPFLLLNDRSDWLLTYLASSTRKGYYSVLRQEDRISLLSLKSNGTLLKSIENNTIAKVHFLKITTSYGFFSFCYITEAAQHLVQCLQLDETLRVNINVTMDLGYPTRFLAVHNLPQSGMILLSVYCPNDDSTCQDHEITLTRFDSDGFHGTFQKFKEEGCAPRKQQQFTFFEDNDKICVYYACNAMRKGQDGGYDKIVRSRCF